ncbi:HalOD1 output domain-containing protein [Halobacterium jilantaiense]|uniref:Halobacterial output domain-containing protein n=1 Tax=Halobacterium jilantaiense TaxID=355548 RepID=A0A1I0MND3_9EURY|nr:HalOD1 output domain-containing protein [Halobacterium jilantaiense]SEV89657.1 hypothetical protein SAMN04487945_0209 [Halobacterium jilantaiense]
MTDANYDAGVGTDADPVIRSRERGESVSESVVLAVSEATDTDPLEMARLADVLDPDALDALFPGDDGTGTLSFRFNGCDVTVHSDGYTVVSQSDGAQL